MTRLQRPLSLVTARECSYNLVAPHSNLMTIDSPSAVRC